MAQPKTSTFEVSPGLARELEASGLTRPAGGACDKCDFVTKKKGFPATQALRAHSKRHKNDNRAWRRPLIGQLLVVAVVLGLGIAGLAGVELPFNLPFTAQIPEFLVDIRKWAVLGVTILLGLVALYMISVPGEEGGWMLARVLGLLVFLSTLVGLWAVAGIWGLVSPALSWTIYLPVAALLIFTPAVAAKAGSVRLVVRRRKVKAKGHMALVEPKNEDARYAIQRFRESVQPRQRKLHKVNRSNVGRGSVNAVPEDGQTRHRIGQHGSPGGAGLGRNIGRRGF